MNSLLRSYNGSVYNPAKLKYVGKTFLESYLNAIENHGNNPCISFVSKDETINKTFAEFHADVCSAVRHMSQNVNAESLVVIVSDNSYPMMVFVIASLVSGRSVVPISENETEQGIEHKLQQLPGSFTVFSSEKFAHKFQSLSLDFKVQDSLSKEVQFLNGFSGPIIYIFTSGSTGYSKIVQQTEAGLLSNISALIETHNMGPGINIATPLSLSHVNALEFSFFSSLFSGSYLIIFDKFDFGTLINVLNNFEVHILSLIPPIIRTIVEGQRTFKKCNLSKIKYIVSAATYLPKELAVNWLGHFGIPICQGYGLSEAINFSCILPPALTLEQNRFWLTNFDVPSIGPSIFGNNVFIFKDDVEAAEGDIGEICIRGWNVMQGYVGDNGEEVFKGDYLHTGDMGYYKLCPWSRKKYFFIVNRKKEIIKRNGITLSLVELDRVLVDFLRPQADAISVGFSNQFAGEELAVIVKCDEDLGRSLIESYVIHLTKKLPLSHVPRLIVATKKSLRTLSGKPLRWVFLQELAKFEKVSFGQVPVLVGFK